MVARLRCWILALETAVNVYIARTNRFYTGLHYRRLYYVCLLMVCHFLSYQLLCWKMFLQSKMNGAERQFTVHDYMSSIIVTERYYVKICKNIPHLAVPAKNKRMF